MTTAVAEDNASAADTPYSAALAQFSHDFRLENAPAVVVEMAHRVLIDQLGCEIAGSTLPWSGRFRASVTALGSSGPARIVNHGDAVSVDDAAFLNSAFGHANEMDDACTRTPTPTSPAAGSRPISSAPAPRTRGA